MSGNGDSKRLESIYAKKIVKDRHRRHIVIVSLKREVESDDTNDGLPDRTIPAVFESAVKSLPQNSAYAIFLGFPHVRKKLNWPEKSCVNGWYLEIG